MSLLRWEAPRGSADASRHCARSFFLGSPYSGVAAWIDRFADLIGRERFDAVLPLDELAHELLAARAVSWPAGTRLVGPSAAAYRLTSDCWRTLALAREAGWRTAPARLLARDAATPELFFPCRVRPRRSVSIVDDEPAFCSARQVGDEAALDAKLRDDLPRGDVLLQAPVTGRRVTLLLAADQGLLLALAAATRAGAPAALAMTEAARGLVARLGWSGLLRIECCHDADGLVLLDLHCGPGDLLDVFVKGGFDLARLLLQGRSCAPVGGTPARPRPPGGTLNDPLPVVAGLAQSMQAVQRKAWQRLQAMLWREPGSRLSQPLLDRSRSILFVCKGNINRSLVAEQVLGAAGFNSVASAGLLRMAGRRPSAAAERFITEELGLPAATLRSRSANRVLVERPQVDLVVCFERRHVIELLRLHPELQGRVHLLAMLAGERWGSVDIPDPHGGSADDHRRCFERIAHLLRLAIAGPGTPSRRGRMASASR